MAQADYVTNAIRALITGAGAKPSRNPVRVAHAPQPIPVEARHAHADANAHKRLFVVFDPGRLPEAHSRPSPVLSMNSTPAARRLPARMLATHSVGLQRYFRFERLGLRNRTPSPVPFSSMKSIPAASKACRIAASLASVTGISPSTTSTRRIVATPTLDAAAKSRAVHRSIARAARI